MGVAGSPAKASAEKGQAIIDGAADALAALITDPDTWSAPQDLRPDAVAGVTFRDRG